MAKKQWTPAQKDAISARGGTVLVSAAAGSGKTAVLIERIMGRILDPEHPIDADRMLVVTFSNAAAMEMKQRLMSALDEAMAEDPNSSLLQRQRRLVERAKICTIHSFCFDLIRENFHRLGIPPNTRAADEKELALLRRDCMEQAIEELYQDQEDASHPLIELLSSGRDDRKLFSTLRDLYDFVRAHPFYYTWMDDKLALYDPAIPAARTPWTEAIFQGTQETLQYCEALISNALKTICTIPEMESAYFSAFQSDLKKFSEIRALCEKRDWDGVYIALKNLKRDRLAPLSGDSPEKAYVTGIRENVYTKIIPKLQKGNATKEGYFCATQKEFAGDVAFLQPLVARLFTLVKRFDEIFSGAKRRRMMIDFSDMEQFAASLLAEPTEGGWKQTELALAAGSVYDEILIDEFQDTNEVQDIIFRALSKKETNLFMVGDVKQSIYRFRQACPQLFIDKKEKFIPYDGKTFPAKIILGKNFRSAPEVTQGINLFFSLLMSKPFGGIDYNQEEALDPGLAYPPGTERGCELHILDLQGDTSDKIGAEAAYVSKKIRMLMDTGYQITEGEKLRPLRYGDICILMRSVKRAKAYRDALQKEGVPVWSEPKNGFLKSREIAPLVCLLRVLGNPLSDMDFVAVMLSPLYGFTADQLAAIRAASPKTTIYEAVKIQAQEGDEACSTFLHSLESLRRYAAQAPADQFLRRVMDETDYLNKAMVMPGGQARRANLLLLIEYARNYHTNCSSVFSFASFLNRLLSVGDDLAPASDFSEQADVVRIMTIHRSKGLEFPVIFLCDCAREFNKMDYSGGILWNSEMGFACARRDFDTRKQYSTVPLQALKLEQQKASLEEELRMLYVALTRAKERLIITGTCRDLDKSLAAWAEGPRTEKLPAYVMRGAKNYLDWLMMVAVRHPALQDCLQSHGITAAPDLSGPLRFVEAAAPQTVSAPVVQEMQVVPSPEGKRLLEERLSFIYPYEAQTRIPGKIAASQLGKGDMDKAYRFTSCPSFLTGKGITGAKKGNALHKFMQFADYEKAAKDPVAEIQRLCQLGFLSTMEAAAVDSKKLQNFFHSALAARIFSAEKVMRELRFLAEAGKEEIGDFLDLLGGESKVVVQGIADCVFIENGGAVIVDYKSDWIASEKDLIDRYRGQLEIYRRLLGQSLGVPVRECILYSFTLSRAITAYKL